MNFGAPGYLWLLVMAGAAAACAVRWWRWRSDARARLGWPAQPGAAAAYLAPAVLLASLALAVFAGALPQLGSNDVLVEQRGVDLVIVLDVSNSMLADDVAPSRLGHAQAEIARLLDRMQGNRAGLVIFAGQPFVRSPLTADLTALGGIIGGVSSERALVAPGSDLGAAIRGAQRLLGGDGTATRAMLVVSDGEDHGAGVAAAVADAQRAGILVYAAGAGTVEGAAVRDVDPDTGAVRDRLDATGAPIVTRMDEAALRAMANAGGGRFFALAAESPPLSGLAAEFAGLEQTAFGTKQSSQPIERFQIVAALALVLLAAPAVLPMLLRRRAAVGSTARLWPLAGAGLMAGAICGTSVADINRRGNNEYARGSFALALAQYGTAEARAPGTGELYHNAGNALDRAGDYDRAIEETRHALPAKPGLLPLVEYALGNHYAGARRLGEASDAYKRALLADPGDADAKHNLEVLTALRTPSPAPTPTATPARLTPEASATGEASTPVGGGAAGTPGPSQTEAAGGAATPGAGDGELSQEELERALAEALAGKDRQFTQDEAIRVLNLLDETNRRAIENLGSGRNPDSLPDY